MPYSGRIFSPAFFRFHTRLLLSLGILLAGAFFRESLEGPPSAQADGWHDPPFYDSPLDYWRRNRERLGFGSGEKEGLSAKPKPPEIQDIDAAQKRYAELLEKSKNESDPARRRSLQDELSLLSQGLANYGLSDGGKRKGDQIRHAFVHQLLMGMAYINPENINPGEFPALADREKFVREIIQVLKEIGPEAVPQLWDHLRNEIACFGVGRKEKILVQEDLNDLQRQIDELTRRQRAAPDRATWDSLEEHLVPLRAQLAQLKGPAKVGEGGPPKPSQAGAPLPGNRAAKSLLAKNTALIGTGAMPYDRIGICVSEDYIRLLTRALLAMGAEGLTQWKQGLWDRNGVVREHTRSAVRELGLPAVPVLIAGLKSETLPEARQALGQALAELSGQSSGTDSEKYQAWWEAHRPAAPIAPPPAPAPTPPAEGPDEIQIGPRP